MASQAALTDALITSINQHREQLQGKRVWLACSGGRDSLSLALLCHQLFQNHQISFLPQLLHVNHGMQMANQDWAEYVNDWADRHNMTCRILNIALNDKSEQAARQARYDAMINVMNCDDVLMLGHHRDDQVETVLMHLFNGAGVNGLSGMTVWTTRHSETNIATEKGGKNVHLWRPWLSISRAKITDYAKKVRLDYIDDPTNIINQSFQPTKTFKEETEYKTSLYSIGCLKENTDEFNINDRAWLRSLIMPLIHERYPQASESIYRTSQLMRDARVIINQQSKTDLTDILINNPLNQSIPNRHSAIDIESLLALPRERQSVAIHTWLHPKPTELPPSKRLVDDALMLCKRTDANHQTSLHWHSSVYHYNIRRYQNTLYRLRQDWLDWLQIPPNAQRFSVSQLSDVISLKDTSFDIVWQIEGITELVAGLEEANLNEVDLQFEPLPRDLKVTLKGRSGRKSGKKLLQALNQPSFMRTSIVLLSVLPNDNVKIPFAIICLNKIDLLETDILRRSPKLLLLFNQNIRSKVR